MVTKEIMQERIAAAIEDGFFFSEKEYEMLDISPVTTKDINVIKYGVELSRKIGAGLISLDSLDFAIEVPKVLGLDHKLVNATAFSIYALAKFLASRIHGGDIVAYDKDFYDQLSKISDGAPLREKIKRDMFAVSYPNEGNQIVRVYGVSRIAGNNEQRADIEIDVSSSTASEIEKLLECLNSYCGRRFSEGKLPSVSSYLTHHTGYDFDMLPPVRKTAPLVSPGVHYVERIRLL